MSEFDEWDSMDLTEIDANLVFARFGKLVKKKDILYSDYIEIDEPDEIGSTWVEFSGKVVQDLLDVVNLTKSLFERLIDELRRSSEDPSSELLEKIKNLTEFWLDLSVVAYLYSTIEKRGVLDQPGLDNYTMGYVNTKKSLDELTLLAFQAGQDFFSLESRITLGEALSLNMEKQRLDYISDVNGGSDLRNQILGEYDKNQALFLMNRVFKKVISSAEGWWFMDPIGLHSASEHALSHIESMKHYWSQTTSDLIERGNTFYNNQHPVATLSSQVSLAQHYRRLAMAALESRANQIAADYFKMAAELTSSVNLEELNRTDRYQIWNKSIPEQYLIYSHMMNLSTISTKYQEILRKLKVGDIESIYALIPPILKQLSDTLSEGDIAYVSSVAVAYETIFVYIQEQLEQGISPNTIISFVENRLQTVGSRLHKASHQLVTNWLKVVKSDINNIEILEEIIANIDYPLMAIFVLPPDSDLVSLSSKELLSVQKVTEALYIAVKAESEFGKNPVKEMLMRAKTFELTQQALSYLSDLGDRETQNLVKSVLDPVSKNAFLRGLIAEIQLRTAVLQFRYVNRIAPIIENSSLKFEDSVKQPPHDNEELENFIESIKELQIAASEVNRHKIPIQIGGAPLNWGYIAKLETYSRGLVDIFKAISHAIKAAASTKKEVEDAITHWDEAKTLTFEAADSISSAGSQESEGLAQEVYSLAQLFYEFENKKRDRKETSEFPVDGVVELISSLLMGL